MCFPFFFGYCRIDRKVGWVEDDDTDEEEDGIAAAAAAAAATPG